MVQKFTNSKNINSDENLFYSSFTIISNSGPGTLFAYYSYTGSDYIIFNNIIILQTKKDS